MLATVAASSTARLIEVRSFLEMIRTMSGSPGAFSSSETPIAKGLFFVHLYGAFEYTVTAAVQETLELVDNMGHSIADFKPMMLSIVLDGKCKAMADVGPKKLWDKKWDLFGHIASANVVAIDNTVLPAGTGNLKYDQLQTIWKSMCVAAPVVPRSPLRGRLQELVENRNAISHGRDSAATVGGRYTVTELQKRYDDVNELCTYVVQCLEDYLKNKDFLV